MNRRCPSPIFVRAYRPTDGGASYSGVPLQESTIDRSIGEFGTTSGLEEKDDGIVNIAHHFSQDSSLHGIKYIGDPSVSKYRRLVWSFFLIGSIAFFLYAVIPRVEYFMRNPVRTKISILYKKPLEFPAVTMCNFNLFRKDYIEQTPVLRNILNHIFKVRGDVLDLNDPVINETLHKYTSYHVMRDGAHQLDMFVSCQFGHDILNCSEYLQQHYTDLGICYTFHSAEFIEQHGRKLISDASGSDYGLRLRIHIQHHLYSYGVSSSAGMKILVHDPHDMPLVREFGFAVRPGTETFAAIKQQKMTLLPAPYENGRCNDTNSKDFVNPLRFFKTYDYSACRMECQLNYTIKMCNCTFGNPVVRYNARKPTKIYGRDAVPFCTLAQWIKCIPTADKAYYSDHNAETKCGCFTPCEVMEYKVQLSSALFPGDHIAHALRKELNLTEEFFRHNLLDLRVYFEEMNYDYIMQEPDYTWQQLIADIGGQMGFCIGASVLSVYEIGELVGLIFGKVVRTIKIREKRVKLNRENDKRLRALEVKSRNGTL